MPAERIEVPVALEVAVERLQRATFAQRWWRFLVLDSHALYGIVSPAQVRRSHRSSLSDSGDGERLATRLRGRFAAEGRGCALTSSYSHGASEGESAHFAGSLRRALNRP